MAAIGMCAIGYNWFEAETQAETWKKRALAAEAQKPPVFDITPVCDGFAACYYLLSSGGDVVTASSIDRRAAAWKRLDLSNRQCFAETAK